MYCLANSQRIFQKVTEYNLDTLEPYSSTLVKIRTNGMFRNMFENKNFKYFFFLYLLDSTDGDAIVRVLRISFVGEIGYEIHIPNENCVQVYNHLLAAGNSDGLQNAGYRALYSLSCEKGTFRLHLVK